MQTKSSYRVLKWTFIFGAMASLGTACVVTSGDGGDDPFGDGGESGSAAEAGKTSTAGTGGTSTAGKGGSASGGSAGTTTTPAAGAGGEGPVYMAGLCDADEPDPLKGISSGKFPSCAPAANDEGQDCKKCLKDKCCEAWQVCYGSEPHIACGWGATEAADGQWDCIENCIIANEAGDVEIDDVVATCTGKCTNQCDDGGNVLIATSDLITCAQKQDTCLDACFPLNL